MGTRIVNSPTRAVAAWGIVASRSRMPMLSSPARRSRWGRNSSAQRRSCADASLNRTGIFLEGAMFISPRIWRTARITDLTHAISRSAASSRAKSPETGYGASITVGPDRPAAGAARCQISSVMNGINGCNARCNASRISINVRRVPIFATADELSDCNTGLVSSRYQSQNSYHVNS